MGGNMIRAVGCVIAGLALSGCGRDGPVQRIALESGDFGVSELAVVRAIDPIILENNVIRFNVAFGEFAVSILDQTAPSARATWEETTRAFGVAVSEELEEYIRGLSCVYTVSLDGDFITSAVADAVRTSDNVEVISDGVVVLGEGSPFEDEPEASDRRGAGSGGFDGDLNVSVVSNCLLGVYRESQVRIVQTPSRMMILPQPGRPNRAAQTPAE
jgi:hypothetical protein